MAFRSTLFLWLVAGLQLGGVMTLALPAWSASVPPLLLQPPALLLQPPPSRAPAAAAAATPTEFLGQSWGRPDAGRLVGPVRFPEALGYHLRRTEHAFATASTVRMLGDALQRVRASNPGIHALAVGDLSGPGGGPLPGHRSHQSGRDVDLGFFYRHPPPAYPRHFVRPRAGNLDPKAMWDLLLALARSSGQPGGVQYVMLDYDLQEVLHRWAVRNGVDRTTLETVLQYPRGQRRQVGLVRHFPGHQNHLHVRFGCAPSDFVCFDGRLR